MKVLMYCAHLTPTITSPQLDETALCIFERKFREKRNQQDMDFFKLVARSEDNSGGEKLIEANKVAKAQEILVATKATLSKMTNRDLKKRIATR